MVVRYFTADQIIETDRRLLAATGGGLFGVRDRDRIEYLAAIVQDDGLFPTLWDKAAMYLHRLARSQAFVDGNKRTALEMAGAFLDENGYEFNPPSPALTVRYMLAVAQSHRSQEQVKGWLRRRSAPKRPTLGSP